MLNLFWYFLKGRTVGPILFYNFQAAKSGLIDLSILWFARRDVDNTYLLWEEDGPNFLDNRNATIGLNSNFYVYSVQNDNSTSNSKTYL